jgi:phosphopantothenoylcysteine synthetase/decarboxylase
MTTPKKSLKKSPVDEVEGFELLNENAMSGTKNKKSFIDDDEDEFDLPLDDLETFNDYIDDEDDDTY